MPATRLLVVAEPKMLNALANGLRVGGRFEITTAQFSDPAALEPLAAQADVVALFYGTKAAPITESLLALAPGMRSRGGLLIAVLQKDQAQQRDECLRAGASDLLFMPMPKDQFVARLSDAASRAFVETEGLSAQVTLSRGGAEPQTHQLEVKVVQSGLIASGASSEPKLDAGELAQVSWTAGAQTFNRWAAVLRSTEPGLRARFVGSSADEDAQLKSWITGLPMPAPSAPPPARSTSSADTIAQAATPGTPLTTPQTVVDASVSSSAPTLISAHAVPPTLLDTPSFPAPPASAPIAAAPIAPASIAPTIVETPAFAAVLVPPAPEPAPLVDAQATVVDLKAVPPTLLEVRSFGAEATTTAPVATAPVPGPAASKSSPGAITAGPPPGFAARPPIRPQSSRPGSSTMPGRPRSIDLTGTTGEHPGISGTGSTDPGMERKISDPAMPARTVSNAANPGVPRPASGSHPGRAITPPRMVPVTMPPASGSSPGALASSAANADALKISDPAIAQAPSAPGVPAPVSSASASSLGAAAPAPAATSSPTLAPVNAATLSASLFDDPPSGEGTASSLPEAPHDLAPLSSWPTPLDQALVRSLLGVILRDKFLPEDAPAEPGAAVRKVVGALPSIDREALGNVGPDSHLHEALSARVQLVHATSDGNKLIGAGEGALVDDAGFTALIQSADIAIKRLQTEADGAITKGEVERLQQVTAASAALSRELLAFKETADRLRGLADAPKLGAGGLDPNVNITSEKRPSSVRLQRDKIKEETRAEQRKTQLAEFTGFADQPATSKQRRNLFILMAVFAVSLANTIFFALPHISEADAPAIEQAGSGVLSIDISEHAAIVTVAPTWMTAYDRKPRLRSLCDALDAKAVRRAAIFIEGTGMAGQLDVVNCQPIGLAPPKPPPPELGGPPR